MEPKYINTKFISTSRLPQRPMTSRGVKPKELKSDIVGATIRKLKLRQPRQSSHLSRNRVAINSQFTDHLRTKIFMDNSMEKEQFKARDFQRTLKKFEEKKQRRKLDKQLKKEMRLMKKREYCLQSPKMALEYRLLENVKKREELAVLNEAATNIQKNWKSRITRRETLKHKEKLKQSCSTIYKSWIKHQKKKENMKDNEKSSLEISTEEIPKEFTKEECMQNINALSDFFEKLKRDKLDVEIKEEVQKDLVEPKQPTPKLSSKDFGVQWDQPITSYEKPKTLNDIERKPSAPTIVQRPEILPRIYSQPELHNTFLKINEKFDVTIDSNALKRVTEYRTALETQGRAVDLSDLQFNPYPPEAKVMPLNVRELEFNLNRKSQHSTFHTDSKLLKELEITSIRPNGNLQSWISQDQKLAYEEYFKKTANPVSFVKFILRSRRGDNVNAKTHSIYDYQSHMPYFSKLAQQSEEYQAQHQEGNIGSLNINLLRSKYQWLNR